MEWIEEMIPNKNKKKYEEGEIGRMSGHRN